MRQILTRRTMLRGAMNTGLALASPLPALATAGNAALATIAAARGISFGSAVSAQWLDDDDFTRLVRRECDSITAENSLKWKYLEPAKGIRKSSSATRITDFAERSGLAMRGHCFMWNHDERMPAWLVAMMQEWPRSRRQSLIRRMRGHADWLSQTFPGIASWDVVNEAIYPRTGEIRRTALSRLMGERFIDQAFEMMKVKAPGAQLVYNDTMNWGASSAHRNGVLRLLERLLARKVPIDALGIQSHLGNTLGRSRDETEWRLFLEEISGMGLDIIVTELDCSDRNVEDRDPVRRDEETAAYTKGYLDLTLDFPRVKQVTTWSLTDATSYMNRPGYPDYKRRPDGLALRGHPYDDRWQPKKMRSAIAEALRAAPLRH